MLLFHIEWDLRESNRQALDLQVENTKSKREKFLLQKNLWCRRAGEEWEWKSDSPHTARKNL